MNTNLRYIHSSVENYLIELNLSTEKVKDVVFITSFCKNTSSPFGGINNIIRVRENFKTNPIVLFSFFSNTYLSQFPEYNIINLPGIYFVELPAFKQELLDVIHAAMPINDTELVHSLKYINNTAGKIVYFLETLKTVDREKVNNLSIFVKNNYSNNISLKNCKSINDITTILYNELPKYELKNQLDIFSHGKSYALINKYIGPINTLYNSYNSGVISEEVCRRIIQEKLLNDGTAVLREKLTRFLETITNLISIEEFSIKQEFVHKLVKSSSIIPEGIDMDFSLSEYFESIKKFITLYEDIQRYSEYNL